MPLPTVRQPARGALQPLWPLPVCALQRSGVFLHAGGLLYRLNRRGEKITDRLGAERKWVLTWLVWPEKPPGMHWETYSRLVQEWETIHAAANADYTAGLMRLIARSDKLLAERQDTLADPEYP